MAQPPTTSPADDAAPDRDVLVTTKFHVPRAGLVPRPRLLERLAQGMERGLTVVCTPAGFGKTTLLGDWARRSRRPTAWLSLDAGDNDPAPSASVRILLASADLDSDGADVDDVQAAVIRVAGQVGERMYLGKDNPQPNWFAEGDHDMEHARHFVQRFFGDDELEGRLQVTLRARSLLRTRWEAVEAIAAKLERDKTVVGEEVERICLAEAARRAARSRAADPPKPPVPTRRPKRPRGVAPGQVERRPFTIRVEKGAQ